MGRLALQSNSRSLLLVPLDGSEPRELMRVPSAVDPADLKRQRGKGNRVFAPMWTTDSKAVLVRNQVAGSEAANKSFGIDLAMLKEASDAATSLKRGALGDNVMYFETAAR